MCVLLLSFSTDRTGPFLRLRSDGYLTGHRHGHATADRTAHSQRRKIPLVFVVRLYQIGTKSTEFVYISSVVISGDYSPSRRNTNSEANPFTELRLN
jgi:hypothetical protein